MTKTERQIALARANQTAKRTSGVILDTLSNLACRLELSAEPVTSRFGCLASWFQPTGRH
jgi:hypothetical protein